MIEIQNNEEFSCSRHLIDSLHNYKSFKEYLSLILMRDRNFLMDDRIFEFFTVQLLKIPKQIITPNILKQILTIIDAFCVTPNLLELFKVPQQIIGDLRAVKLICLSGLLDSQNEFMLKLCEILHKLKMDYSTKQLESDPALVDKMPPNKRIKFDPAHPLLSTNEEIDPGQVSTIDECNNSSQQTNEYPQLITLIDEIISLIKSD